MTRRGLGFTMIWILAAGSATGAPEAEPVRLYVSENGTAYHREPCRRLRFEREVSMVDAVANYTACPICQPGADSKGPAETVVAEEGAAPVRRASARASATPSPVRALAVRAPPLEPVRAPPPAPAPVTPPESSHRMSPRDGRGGPLYARITGVILGGAVGFVGGAFWSLADCPGGRAGACVRYRLAPSVALGAFAGYKLGGALTTGGGRARRTSRCVAAGRRCETLPVR